MRAGLLWCYQKYCRAQHTTVCCAMIIHNTHYTLYLTHSSSIHVIPERHAVLLFGSKHLRLQYSLISSLSRFGALNIHVIACNTRSNRTHRGGATDDTFICHEGGGRLSRTGTNSDSSFDYLTSESKRIKNLNLNHKEMRCCLQFIQEHKNYVVWRM